MQKEEPRIKPPQKKPPQKKPPQKKPPQKKPPQKESERKPPQKKPPQKVPQKKAPPPPQDPPRISSSDEKSDFKFPPAPAEEGEWRRLDRGKKPSRPLVAGVPPPSRRNKGATAEAEPPSADDSLYQDSIIKAHAAEVIDLERENAQLKRDISSMRKSEIATRSKCDELELGMANAAILQGKIDELERRLEAETQLRKEGEQKMEIARRRCAASNQTNMQAVGMMRQKNADFAEKIRKMNNDRDLSKKASDAAIAQAEGEAKRFEAQVAKLEEENEVLLKAFGECDDEMKALQATIQAMGALGDKARAVVRGRDSASSASSSSGGPSSSPPVGSADSKRRKKKKTRRRRREGRK